MSANSTRLEALENSRINFGLQIGFGKIVLSKFARIKLENITDSAIDNQLKSLGRSFFYCKIDTRKCSYFKTYEKKRLSTY